eukprot:TRINITY_DN12228_c0_g1_i1.p1 TRINITY_DN12228_c0_g1~~TRINITY_DN12228_c0_g1_i1.p1  ORF type:complete len:252 (-),score=63.24 TRINITY_DN12228_c0_g1_i1:36-758(-)
MENQFEKGTPENPWRVYADGVYDLFHVGHMRSLMNAKSVEENVYLIVGVSGDEETNRIKGKTVLNQEQRSESVRHCRYADEVICPGPWVVTDEFLVEHDIDFVVHGPDISYDENGNDCYAHLKEIGKFRTVPRTEGISTSDIIRQICVDYDDYLIRNLNRGFTRQDLNISYLKEKNLKVRSKFQDMKKGGKERVKGIWQNSDAAISDFINNRFNFARGIWGKVRSAVNNSLEESSTDEEN